MGEGIKTYHGAFTGTGAQLDVTKVGFRPSSVKLLNKTGLCRLEWHDDMANASGYKMVTDGTTTFITSGGITPLSNGFRLGADANINAAGEIVHFECLE